MANRARCLRSTSTASPWLAEKMRCAWRYCNAPAARHSRLHSFCRPCRSGLVIFLMQAETQHIQLAATQIVQQVLENWRNLNQVLDEALRNNAAWAPAQRAAMQDLSYGALRFYGQLQAVRGLLLHNPLPDERVACLLLVALYQLQYGKSAQHAVVDHAVRAARSLNPRIGGLVNAVLRNFLRNQAALLEQAAQ